MATVLGLDQTMADSTSAPASNFQPESSPQLTARDIHPDAFEDQSHSCRLGIAVEHHFVMADLSLSIERLSQPTATVCVVPMKMDMVVFKGVEKNLSDVMQLTPKNPAYSCAGFVSGWFIRINLTSLEHLRLAANNYSP